MLLSSSASATGLNVDVDAVLDREYFGDAGVPAGAELLRFTSAVETGSLADIDLARQQLTDAIGDEATAEAAATIAIFNGLLRVADGTGIPLDEGMWQASGSLRNRAGIDNFAGATNSSTLTPTDSDKAEVDVARLFG